MVLLHYPTGSITSNFLPTPKKEEVICFDICILLPVVLLAVVSRAFLMPADLLVVLRAKLIVLGTYDNYDVEVVTLIYAKT